VTGRIDTRLHELGIVLPIPRAPSIARVEFYTLEDGFLFLSGQIPLWNGERRFIGKLGREFSTAEGQEAAKLSMLNVLAAAKEALDGDLDRVEKVMKLVGFVNCTPDFDEISQVINGASDLVIDIFGDIGRHARTAIGANSMPFGVAVEMEAVFRVS
jgi:enamine deaminase RidA (YjgF/YER057c/UK114 family)